MFDKFNGAVGLIWIWLAFFALVALIAGIASGLIMPRKIQPGTFRWRNVRRELGVGCSTSASRHLL